MDRTLTYYFLYSITDSKLKTTDTSGKTQERELRAGESGFFQMQAHLAENIGSDESRLLVVELKQ